MVAICQEHLGRLAPPRTEAERHEHDLDIAAVAELDGQIAGQRSDFHAALKLWQEAWRLSAPIARSERVFVGATFITCRSSTLSFYAASAIATQEGRFIRGHSDVATDTALNTIITKIADLSNFTLAKLSVRTTKDERLAGNVAQALALADKPEWAAVMVQLGLPKNQDVRAWTPPGWSKPVMDEPYMSSTLQEYLRCITA